MLISVLEVQLVWKPLNTWFQPSLKQTSTLSSQYLRLGESTETTCTNTVPLRLLIWYTDTDPQSNQEGLIHLPNGWQIHHVSSWFIWTYHFPANNVCLCSVSWVKELKPSISLGKSPSMPVFYQLQATFQCQSYIINLHCRVSIVASYVYIYIYNIIYYIIYIYILCIYI